jgi:hypothetical protein
MDGRMKKGEIKLLKARIYWYTSALILLVLYYSSVVEGYYD